MKPGSLKIIIALALCLFTFAAHAADRMVWDSGWQCWRPEKTTHCGLTWDTRDHAFSNSETSSSKKTIKEKTETAQNTSIPVIPPVLPLDANGQPIAIPMNGSINGSLETVAVPNPAPVLPETVLKETDAGNSRATFATLERATGQKTEAGLR